MGSMARRKHIKGTWMIFDELFERARIVIAKDRGADLIVCLQNRPRYLRITLQFGIECARNRNRNAIIEVEKIGRSVEGRMRRIKP